MGEQALSSAGIVIVYDGDCPLCQAYVRRLRLKEAAGSLRLVDARRDKELAQSLAHRGYPLDDGMVVQVGDALYHGAAAVHALALMSSRAGWFNRLNYQLFRSRHLARWIYPPLAAGRRLLLRLLGRPSLAAQARPQDYPDCWRRNP